jgi:hypothetical protein
MPAQSLRAYCRVSLHGYRSSMSRVRVRVPASIFEVNADVVKDLNMAHIISGSKDPCPKVPAVKVSSSIHVVRNLNTTDTLVPKIFHAQHPCFLGHK